jgi:hypothetical protein
MGQRSVPYCPIKKLILWLKTKVFYFMGQWDSGTHLSVLLEIYFIFYIPSKRSSVPSVPFDFTAKVRAGLWDTALSRTVPFCPVYKNHITLYNHNMITVVRCHDCHRDISRETQVYWCGKVRCEGCNYVLA